MMKKHIVRLIIGTIIINCGLNFVNVKASNAFVNNPTTVYNGVDYSAEYYPQTYYDNYPDLQVAIGNDGNALIKHYVEHGKAEGRDAKDAITPTITSTAITTNSQRPTPIDIVGYRISENSVCGISPIIYWQNTSAKDISSVNFSLTPYNSAGKKECCDIRGYSTKTCVTSEIVTANTPVDNVYIGGGEFSAIFNKDSGNPYYFRNDETRAPYTTAEMSCSFSNLSVWDCIWYNGAISNIKIGKVKINYTDGTSETIDASKVISMKN